MQTHPAHRCLHHGIQPSLWGIQVARDELLPHFTLELLRIISQREDVLVGEGRLALSVLVGAGVLQLLGVRVHEGQHCLVHEGAKP